MPTRPHARRKNAGGYLICAADLGWVCLGCDAEIVAAAGGGGAEPATGLPCGASGGAQPAEPTALRVTPRDAFRRRLFLQPLGVMVTVDGATVEWAELRLRPGGAPAVAKLRLAPSPAGVSTHALVTLRSDGEAPEGRRLELLCPAPCALEAGIFPGGSSGAAAAAAADVFRVRFGSAEGATVEMRRAVVGGG